ncbi:MAG: IPT/TIG domain-containing protein [Candidatus Nomurabacteria bacterium]|jgi:hypothetical protein|nr:IPT/TIG domain-containing protein [Candidatus Nomurabacteria bacterium]
MIKIDTKRPLLVKVIVSSLAFKIAAPVVLAGLLVGGGLLLGKSSAVQVCDIATTTICIDEFTPGDASTQGNTTVTMTGSGWAFGNYVGENDPNTLIAWYDALENSRTEENTYELNQNATAWADKSGNQYDLVLRRPTANSAGAARPQGAIPNSGQYVQSTSPTSLAECQNTVWSAGVFLSDYCYFARSPIDTGPAVGNQGAISSVMSKLPLGAANRTIEIVLDPSQVTFTGANSVNLAGYGSGSPPSGTIGRYFGTGARGLDYWFNAMGNSTYTMHPQALYDPAQSVNTATIAVDTTQPNFKRTWYFNGLDNTDGVGYDHLNQSGANACGINPQYDCRDYTVDTTDIGSFLVGSAPNAPVQDTSALYTTPNSDDWSSNFELYAVRVYNRALTKAEIAQNYQADLARYIAPPEIWIGTDSSGNGGTKCDSLNVLSATQISCVAPAHASGPVNVALKYDGKTAVMTDAIDYKTAVITGIMPNKGGMAGGQTVTITGSGWAYDAAKDYIQDGLIAHYDAIDNTGLGDNYHANATSTWKDLSDSGADLTLHAGDNSFDGDGFVVKSATNYWYVPPFGELPTGNSSFTIEARYLFVGPLSIASGGSCIVGWGASSNNLANCVGVRTANQLLHGFYNNDINIDFPSANSTANTLSVSYEAGSGPAWQQTARQAYGNGQILAYQSLGGTVQWTDPTVPSNKCLYIGSNIDVVGCGGSSKGNAMNDTNIKFQSVRIYNKALTDAEVEQNHQVDRARFIATPEITIGGAVCTNVAVVSATKLTCKTPSHAVAETVNVDITYDGQTSTLPSSFTYQDLSITGISPTSGPTSGGQRVTITGANLPYAATSDYVQDGLVAFYDGINNTGEGDKYHSTTTTTWKNLAGTAYLPDATMCQNTDCSSVSATGNASWAGNSVLFASGNNSSWLKLAPYALQGNVTIEAVYSKNGYGVQQFLSNVQDGGFALSTETGGVAVTDNLSFLQYINGGYQRTLANNGAWFNGSVVSLSGLNVDTGSSCKVQLSANGAIQDTIDIGNPCVYKQPDNNTTWAIGVNPNGQNGSDSFTSNSNYYALRLYNRALTTEELAQNATVDQLRYVQVPTISLGTNESTWSPCVDVAVLDYSTITCTTTAHDPINNARVRLTPHGSSTNYEIANAYSYVDPATNTTFTSYAPSYLDAVGGDRLQFTGGTRLSFVTGITIDGDECVIDTGTQTATFLECVTPSENDFRAGNHKDFTVTVGYSGEQVITGKVEYREFLSLSGIPSNVNLSSSNRTDTKNMIISTNSQSGYNVTVQTVNVGRDTGHRSDLMCEQGLSKYYISVLSSEAATLPVGNYGVKAGNGNYLPLSHSSLTLHDSLLPSQNFLTPDTIPLTLGVNTESPTVACSTYTGSLLYSLTVNY